MTGRHPSCRCCREVVARGVKREDFDIWARDTGAAAPVEKNFLSPQDEQRKRELRKYLGGAYHRLDLQLRREGRRPWQLREPEVYAFKLRDDALTVEMLSMRRLYEEKNGI